MNWIKKHKIPAIEAIQYNSRPYIELDDLWQALHWSFNSAQDYQIDSQLLKEISGKEVMKWNLFLKKEFISTIKKCNNSLTPGLDKSSWRHLKRTIKDVTCIYRFIDITNIYINIGRWLLYFKVSTTIVIPKQNKESYDFPKAY